MSDSLYPELMSWPDVTLRRMFGADCFLVRGRMFAFARDGVVAKVAEARYQDALALPGSAPFQIRPGLTFGRWVRFPAEDDGPADGGQALLSWLRLAYEYVLAEPPRRRGRGRRRPFGGRG